MTRKKRRKRVRCEGCGGKGRVEGAIAPWFTWDGTCQMCRGDGTVSVPELKALRDIERQLPKRMLLEPGGGEGTSPALPAPAPAKPDSSR